MLKLDRSFVAAMDDSPAHAALLDGVLAMAARLELPTVVEGIETQAQLDRAARVRLRVRARATTWAGPARSRPPGASAWSSLFGVRVLAIDGGGIRGLIPALVLAEIEQRTGRPHRRAGRPDRRHVDGRRSSPAR